MKFLKIYLLFTIHFATINTNMLNTCKRRAWKFTIHFATINTAIMIRVNPEASSFTIHFATINTD